MDFIPIARPSLNQSDLDGIRDVFTSRWLGLGKVTTEFESQVSKLCDDRPVLATNTGTTAIELALRAIGIGPGDDVLVPAMTFVATAQAIQATGAHPILCDIDASTFNVSVETLESARTATTRAAIPVSYRGLALDIESIVVWGKENAIRIVEDAAHAFGSQTPEGIPVGACGDITCFSFDPIKNITCGEGGAIVFSENSEHETASQMRVLGISSTAWSRLEARRPWEYDVTGPGYRFHMPNLNAAIGLSQLERLAEFRATKQHVLSTYQEAFQGHPTVEIPTMPVAQCLPFLAIVLVDDREGFMAHMKAREIGTGVQYQPLHTLSYFSTCPRTALPVTESIAERIVSIPLLNDQTPSEIERVVEAVLEFA